MVKTVIQKGKFYIDEHYTYLAIEDEADSWDDILVRTLIVDGMANVGMECMANRNKLMEADFDPGEIVSPFFPGVVITSSVRPGALLMVTGVDSTNQQLTARVIYGMDMADKFTLSYHECQIY